MTTIAGSSGISYRLINVDDDENIQQIITHQGLKWTNGYAYYELGSTKEDISAGKEMVAIKKGSTSGIDDVSLVRTLLGVGSGKIKLNGNDASSKGYTVYIQSTSARRNIKAGTHILYKLDDNAAEAKTNKRKAAEDDEVEEEVKEAPSKKSKVEVQSKAAARGKRKAEDEEEEEEESSKKARSQNSSLGDDYIITPVGDFHRIHVTKTSTLRDVISSAGLNGDGYYQITFEKYKYSEHVPATRQVIIVQPGSNLGRLLPSTGYELCRGRFAGSVVLDVTQIERLKLNVYVQTTEDNKEVTEGTYVLVKVQDERNGKNHGDDIIRCQNNRYRKFEVTETKETIQDVLSRNGVSMTGDVFYQLGSKKEDISANKSIVAVNMKDNTCMDDANEIRTKLKLGKGKIKISAIPNYTLWIQSTSGNRGLIKGTHILMKWDGNDGPTKPSSVPAKKSAPASQKPVADDDMVDDDKPKSSKPTPAKPFKSSSSKSLSSSKYIKCGDNKYRKLLVENDKETIQDVCDRNDIMAQGDVYYQLGSKKEDISANKSMVAVNNDTTKGMDDADEIRSTLKLGKGKIKISSNNAPNYTIWVQSTSKNRGLIEGTYILVKTDGDDEEEEDDDEKEDVEQEEQEENEEENEDGDEDEDEEDAPSTKVLIPSWASTILPPITSSITDLENPKKAQNEWDEDDKLNTCMYTKGICQDVFLGNECKDSSPQHLTRYFRHISPDILALDLKQRQPADLYPFYGHPAQAYTWFNHGIHAYTKAIQDGTRMPDVIAKIVAEYAGPSINRVWMVPNDEEDEPRDDVIIRRLPRHPVGAIRSQLGGLGYLRLDEPHPICGECKWRMPLYLQLRLSDMPMETAMGYALPGIPIERQLLQCWGCPQDDQNAHSDGTLIPTPESMNKTRGSGACIRIIDMGDAAYQTNIVKKMNSDQCHEFYHDEKEKDDITKPPPQLQVQFIKKWMECEATPLFEEWSDVLNHDYDSHAIRALAHETDHNDAENTGNTMGTKLGGYPYWDNGNCYRVCDCGRSMQSVFQIDHFDEIQWGEGTSASIQQCPVHRHKFAFSWDCD